jgi:Arc/MetJ-type ribon-helix-helix transcriptional regulator
MVLLMTLEISLPDALKQIVERHAAQAGFPNVSAYVESLIEDDLRRSEGQIEAELIKGLDSGPPIEADDAFWAGFRARYQERLSRSGKP